MLDSCDTPRVRRGPDHLLHDPSNKPVDRPVPDALKQLELAQELLEKKLDRLAGMLSPVLSPTPCGAFVGEPHPGPPQDAPLVQSLRSLTARLNGHRNLVDELIDRLAV